MTLRVDLQISYTASMLTETEQLAGKIDGPAISTSAFAASSALDAAMARSMFAAACSTMTAGPSPRTSTPKTTLASYI